MAHASKTPYPVDLPLEEIRLLLDFVRGRSTDKSSALHSGWVVAGYACSKLSPHPDLKAVGDMDVPAVLESLTLPTFDPQASIPWDRIIAFILDLLRDLLRN